MSQQKKVGVGIIGSGFGGRVVLPCFSAVPNIQVIAWASRTPVENKNTAAQYEVPQMLSSWEEMLKMKEVDLVCITTPPFLHYTMVKQSLQAGKHVLCEKPLALNVAEADEMSEFARSSSSFCRVDHQLRFHPNFLKIKSLIDEGQLGKIHHVQLTYQTAVRLDPNLSWDWWSDITQGGGELNAIGSHFVDALRWWFGEVRAVQGLLRMLTSSRPDSETKRSIPVSSDEYAAFHLAFKSETIASVVLSSVSRDEPSLEIRISGEKASLALSGFDRLTLSIKPGQAEEISEPDSLSKEPVIGLNPWRTSLVRFAEHLSSCILQSRKPQGATFEDGLRTQIILDAIRESDRSKHLIPLAD